MPPKLIADFLCARDARSYAGTCLKEFDAHGNNSTSDPAIGGRNRILRFGFSYETPSNYRLAPDWLVILSHFAEANVFSGTFLDVNRELFFNSYVLNEYLPGNSIAAHLDPNCADPVAILSLQSDGEMWFRPVMDCNAKPSSITLPVGSLLVMAGDSLRKWTHEIPPVKEKRLSIVFRRRSD